MRSFPKIIEIQGAPADSGFAEELNKILQGIFERQADPFDHRLHGNMSVDSINIISDDDPEPYEELSKSILERFKADAKQRDEKYKLERKRKDDAEELREYLRLRGKFEKPASSVLPKDVVPSKG